MPACACQRLDAVASPFSVLHPCVNLCVLEECMHKARHDARERDRWRSTKRQKVHLLHQVDSYATRFYKVGRERKHSQPKCIRHHAFITPAFPSEYGSRQAGV